MRIVLLSKRNKSRSAGFAKEIRQQIKWLKRQTLIKTDQRSIFRWVVEISSAHFTNTLWSAFQHHLSLLSTSSFSLSSSVKLPRTTRGFQSVRKRIYHAVLIEKQIPHNNVFHLVHKWMAHVCVRVREENSIHLPEICAIEYFITLSSSNIIFPVARCLSGVLTPFPSRPLSSNKFLSVHFCHVLDIQYSKN